MSIFVSWSGPSNRDVGRKVKQFVSEVLGTDTVFMSDEDIAPGDKSLEEIDLALRRSTAALVIVSAKTAREPWLNFEAGAMAVRLAKTSVIPILLDLTFSQLIQPLAQFQAIQYNDKEKFRRTLNVLNSQRGDERIKSDTLDIVFEARWPTFQSDVAAIIADSSSPADAASLPNDQDKMDEILSTLRGLANNALGAPPTIWSESRHPSSALRKDEEKSIAASLQMRIGHLGEIKPLRYSSSPNTRGLSASIEADVLSELAVKQVRDLALGMNCEIVIAARSAYYVFPQNGASPSLSKLL